MISIGNEGMKTGKLDFTQARRSGQPVHQVRDFGFRRASEAIKQGLRASSCLLFLNLIGYGTPVFTFSPNITNH